MSEANRWARSLLLNSVRHFDAVMVVGNWFQSLVAAKLNERTKDPGTANGRDDKAPAISRPTSAKCTSRHRRNRSHKRIGALKYGHLEEHDQSQVFPACLSSEEPNPSSVLSDVITPGNVRHVAHTSNMKSVLADKVAIFQKET